MNHLMNYWAVILDNFSVLMKFAISLLSVLNPFGAIPMFLTMTRSSSEIEIKKISTSCSWAVSITILVSVIMGHWILQFFGISIASFRVGGGILIGVMGLQMLHARPVNSKLRQDELENQNVEEIGIVPLAIPLLSGPATISTSMIHAEHFKHPIHWIGAIIIITLFGLGIRYFLIFSRQIGHRMGKVGLNVTTRIMGLILMALSVEFVSIGVKELFKLG